MSEFTATNLANVLNNQPLAGYIQSYTYDDSFIRMVGGIKVKPGRFQWTSKIDGNSTVGPFTASTDLSSGDTTGRALVTAYPKRYGFRIEVDNLDERLVDNGGVLNMTDYILEESDAGMMDLFTQINSDCEQTNATTGAINSIDNILATPTGSGNFYDLARSSNSWANVTQVSASAGEKMQTSHLDALDLAMKRNRKVNYDVVLMSHANVKRYETLLNVSSSFYGYKDVSVNDARFQALTYNGKPVVGTNIADDVVYFGSANDMEIWALPSKNEGIDAEGIFTTKEIAQTTDKKVFAVSSYLNLIIKNPFRWGAICNLTSP